MFQKFIFALLMLFIVPLTADHCPCGDKSDTDWNGIGRFSIQPEGVSCYETSFLIEAGSRHFRGSGTIGAWFSAEDRFKTTAEWLIDSNRFGFCGHDDYEWVNQGALGIAYQHVFENPYLLSFDMMGSYSHAFSQELCTVAFSFDTLVRRNITGSNAFDVSFGATFFTFCKGTLSAYAVYDRVIYQRQFSSDLDVKGFGGGVRLFQPLGDYFDLTAYGEFREPYNYYELDINYYQTFWDCRYSLGLFASYTQGKHHLTNNGKIGVQISFPMECKENPSWFAAPAVYRPKVLSIKDQECVSNCCHPFTHVPSLDAIVFSGEEHHIDGNIIHGGPLEYVLEGNPNGVTVDERGKVTVPSTLNPGCYNFTMRATNHCGETRLPVMITVI